MNWHEQPLVVIDVETTGFDADKDKLVEIAAVWFNHGKEVGAYSTLIDPGIPIPPEAAAVHGISDEMVKGQLTALQAVIDLQHTQAGVDYIPCAYNAPFDKKFWFANSLARVPHIALVNPEQVWLDPLVMVRHLDKYVPGQGRHKLEKTCKRWGIDTGTSHRAEDDARATGLLTMAIAEKMPPMELQYVLERQEIRRAEQDAEREAYYAGKR